MIGQIIWLVFVGVVLLFGFVVLFGAPYLPTLDARTQEAFSLLDLQSGQTLLELGCGDGRVLREAGKRGIRSIGYELNPLLVLCAKAVTWRYRSITTVKWRNYWQITLPPADGIYVFLLDRFMPKLNTKITQEQQRSVRLVSFAFAIPSKKPSKQQNGLFVYDYPWPESQGNNGIEK